MVNRRILSYLLSHFRRQQPTNCLSVFDHFMGLALKGLQTCSLLNLEEYIYTSHKVTLFLKKVISANAKISL